MLAVGAALGALGAWIGFGARGWIDEWATAHGHHAHDKSKSFWKGLLAVPGRMLRSPDVPHLQFDVKLAHMQRIWQKRAEALAKGLLETESDDLVPAALSVDGRTHRVEMRLKGDWTDHLQGAKWSFRIEVPGDDHVFGMRRFSIQDPRTRGFQGEALFFAVLRDLGVVTPRLSFVTASLNGTDMGLMALEEHASRELLEHNGRRDSVIVKFDETLVFHGLDDYRSAPIAAFQPGRIAKDPLLSAERDTAIGLLRGFVDGSLTASQVFDVDELTALLATAELFGSSHSLRWHNLRFYFDPITARLGPIGFDASLQTRAALPVIVTAREPITARMLTDAAVWSAFERQLDALCNRAVDGTIARQFAELDRGSVDVLQSEFFLLEPFDWRDLARRAEYRTKLGAAARREFGLLDDYALAVRASLVRDGADTRLELVNALPHRVRIHGLRWVAGDREHAFEPLNALKLPLDLPAEDPARLAGRRVVRIPCRPAPAPFDTVELDVGLLGRARRDRVPSVLQPAAAEAPPVPTSTARDQLATHAFLTLAEDGRTLRIAPGEHVVRGVLVVPPGHCLEVAAGACLRFATDGALIAHGPVQLAGRPDAPIVLEGIDGASWSGVAVLDPGEPVVWCDVRIRNTTGVALPRWQLTGAVSFVDADVTLRSTHFSGSTAEDALNIVRGRFDLDDVTICDTRSDALDVDFADGTVRGGQYKDIGGDAIDVSGSRTRVAGTRITGVRDKALSVGERSAMEAERVHIERAGTGAASKDDSTLWIRDSSIAACRHASLAAYVKKPEFGPASIRAERVQTTGEAPAAVCQTASKIVVDGKEQPARDLDVDSLYRTVMSKDGAR